MVCHLHYGVNWKPCISEKKQVFKAMISGGYSCNTVEAYQGRLEHLQASYQKQGTPHSECAR